MHEKLTLNNVKKSSKLTEKVFRASDYLSEEELNEVHESNARGKRIERPFDDIDAFGAEILARFGWQAYQAWLSGEFAMDKALRFVAAERARDKQALLNLEGIIITANYGANNADKHGKLPSTLKRATELYQKEIKQAQGAQN